jgi:hypothetical protein
VTRVLELVNRIGAREHGFVVWLDHAGFHFLPEAVVVPETSRSATVASNVGYKRRGNMTLVSSEVDFSSYLESLFESHHF